MQIQELKERIPDSNSNDSNIFDITQILGGLEIKPYLPVAEKKLIADSIINSCIEIDENSIMKIDYFNKIIISNMSFIINYTNLIFSDDSIEDYDFLCKYKILDYIINSIDIDELNFINKLVEDELKQVLQIGNSLEGIIAKGLNKLIEKIPDEKGLNRLINNIPKAMNKLKPENLSLMKELFNQKQEQNFMGGLNRDMVKNDNVNSGIEITE